MLFGSLFVLANPDLVTAVVDFANPWLRRLEQWLLQLDVGEMIFLLAAAWFSTGLLRPMFPRLPRLMSVSTVAR